MGLRVQSKAENSTEPRWLYGCRGLGQAPDGGGGESHRRAAARAGPGLPTASTRGSLEAGTGTRPAVMKMSAARQGRALSKSQDEARLRRRGRQGDLPHAAGHGELAAGHAAVKGTARKNVGGRSLGWVFSSPLGSACSALPQGQPPAPPSKGPPPRLSSPGPDVSNTFFPLIQQPLECFQKALLGN